MTLKKVRSRPVAGLASRSAGFSLVEVLISIVILSIGLLGLVGLQAAALQGNRDARLQSAAVSLARELAEMMRGNKDVGLLTTSNPYIGDFSSPLTPTTSSYCLNVGGTACSDTTTIANAQMTEWLSRVDNELPGARVVVCLDAQPFDTTTGLPQWTCTATGAGLTTLVKIGWTRNSTDRSAGNSAPIERAVRPSIVLPVTPGNT
jgi:type IV pilus assembly protein PilV